MPLDGASCATAGAARAAGTASFCGLFFQAQNPSASDHEADLVFASSTGGGMEAGGGVTVVEVGAMAAVFSLFAAAAAAAAAAMSLYTS